MVAMTSRLTKAECTKDPHIVFIMANDLGWRDVSWNPGSDMYTPNLAKMRAEGVNLANHYMQSAGSASIASFYTGYYPWKKFGLQQDGDAQYFRWRNGSLPLTVRILPEYLRRKGYSTHLVGKWQMGFCNWQYTPTRRGFETFYGGYGGNADQQRSHTDNKAGCYDFRDNLNVDLSANGSYATDLHVDRAEEIIHEHSDANDSRPLFLFMSLEAPHTPNQLPERSGPEQCLLITDQSRRDLCSVIANLDDGIGQIQDTLTELFPNDKLLMVFTSDNGANSGIWGSNWPLRGKKRSVYEGGVRVPAFIWSKNLLQQPREYEGVFHVSDWVPTLLSAAGFADVSNLLPSDVDGVNQWPSIENNTGGRSEMVLAMDNEQGYGAVRLGNWKLVKDPSGKNCMGWFQPPVGTPPLPIKLLCDEYQLFDLSVDPYEKTNLAANNSGKLQELKIYYETMAALATPFPVSVNITDGFLEGNGRFWGPGWC